jgi:hypothetical protein
MRCEPARPHTGESWGRPEAVDLLEAALTGWTVQACAGEHADAVALALDGKAVR